MSGLGKSQLQAPIKTKPELNFLKSTDLATICCSHRNLLRGIGYEFETLVGALMYMSNLFRYLITDARTHTCTHTCDAT